jgi:murein L,D-transpeptidase YafK
MVASVVLAVVTAVSSDPCAGQGTSMLVNTKERVLLLCDESRARARHPIALGRGGVDKRREGDGRVPLGKYAIGEPRPSSSFHLFIPVDYPTAEQRRQGYTGGAIGVHGPARVAQGPFSTSIDWTLGCIAVGTDGEIKAIARWVKDRSVKRITIVER